MNNEGANSLSMLKEDIFSRSKLNFDNVAIELFHYQYSANAVYREYCDLIKCNPKNIQTIIDIPFLPISFFKTHDVKSNIFIPEETFYSSGTTGNSTSQHFVKDISIYEQSFISCFEQFYGNIDKYCVLGLLPSYLERKGSSLIYMVNEFIHKSKHEQSGFFLKNHEALKTVLEKLSQTQEKTLLIGVSFALLDFIEKHDLPFNKNLIVMETGGMKGKRKEMIREELHVILTKNFKTTSIHSEYGMTELLSQAYSKGEGKFHCPAWMKVLIRKQDDPFSYETNGNTGAINVIDLANIHSCAFIQTDDLGKQHKDESFEVLGRFDAADVRGCNLLVS